MSKRLMQFFKYPGSKFRTVPYYPKPLYSTIREDFAGSASYSTFYWWYNIHLNDIDSNVAGLWNWLIQASINDILSIPTDMPLLSSLSDYMNAYQVELCKRWQRVGHSTCPTVSKWNGKAGLWNHRVRDHLADQLINIRSWNVSNLSYLDTPNDECTRFVDPPYVGFNFYEYKRIDYKQLAEWCLSRNGQTIVCEQEGADWLPFKPFRQIVSGRPGGHTKFSNEVVCEIIDGIICDSSHKKSWFI